MRWLDTMRSDRAWQRLDAQRGVDVVQGHAPRHAQVPRMTLGHRSGDCHSCSSYSCDRDCGCSSDSWDRRCVGGAALAEAATLETGAEYVAQTAVMGAGG